MQLFCSCASPQLNVKPIPFSKETSFEISTKGINGLLGIHFWEGKYVWTGKPDNSLWRARLDYYPGPIVTYGRVPINFTTFNGNAGSGRSESGKAKPLPQNRTIYMEINYQYDAFMAASARSKAFSFKIAPSGEIINFKEEAQKFIAIPEAPSRD